MASSMLLHSTLPRTFASATGRNILRSALQVRAASSTTQYVPGGPIIKGTVNDPTEFPPPSRTHGSYHWHLSAFLQPPFLVMHSHLGFDSMIVDYVHPRKFPILGPVMTWTLRSATVGVLVGVYQFNTNDIGLTELIAKVWTA
ncbi:SDHD, membrane anchor subunit of succinate dehydrogenase [Suillus clintonianus]|uniref:SDHD, membrane anchor subunit of succinate dehydrogenase n=1 Tax=Suillus clintonianus TaxID=1904413 RepID=UPI001B87FD14|nr:SDHD, membrane anchor subunit of succinate dehydrogenase [Suillus clintonianus]KAG2142973.1 SDHD, membrane anchor subunit of succinate dehydrogenase [Suillus clintonianus]